MLDAKLKHEFWAEGVSTAVYLSSHCPTKAVNGMTLFQAWYHVKLKVKHLWINAHVHVPKNKNEASLIWKQESVFCQKKNPPIQNPVSTPALKRVLHYLKGMMRHGICYSHKRSVECVEFSDADWAGDVNDRKSTSGDIFNNSASCWLRKSSYARMVACLLVSTMLFSNILLTGRVTCFELQWNNEGEDFEAFIGTSSTPFGFCVLEKPSSRFFLPPREFCRKKLVWITCGSSSGLSTKCSALVHHMPFSHIHY